MTRNCPMIRAISMLSPITPTPEGVQVLSRSPEGFEVLNLKLISSAWLDSSSGLVTYMPWDPLKLRVAASDTVWEKMLNILQFLWVLYETYWKWPSGSSIFQKWWLDICLISAPRTELKGYTEDSKTILYYFPKLVVRKTLVTFENIHKWNSYWCSSVTQN